MESKKVKEIKKALKCCYKLTDKTLPEETRDNACKSCPYHKFERCATEVNKTALRVINELESINERKEGYYNAVKELALELFVQKIKAEIPAESTFEYLGYNGVMEIIDETLKEFLGK